jgi:hypothetical protein
MTMRDEIVRQALVAELTYRPGLLEGIDLCDWAHLSQCISVSMAKFEAQMKIMKVAMRDVQWRVQAPDHGFPRLDALRRHRRGDLGIPRGT